MPLRKRTMLTRGGVNDTEEDAIEENIELSSRNNLLLLERG